jgi:hypothetical protein
VQAATLVSSLFESAVTVAYIGGKETLAKDWIRRGTKDPLKSFRGVWEMTQAAVAGLGLPDTDTKAETLYKAYTQLCWAKHGSSAFLLHQSYTPMGADIEARNGPNTSDSFSTVAFRDSRDSR